MRGRERDDAPLAVTSEASEGVEGLPGRLARYGEARKRALDVLEHTPTGGRGKAAGAALMLERCGNWLVLRHWLAHDQVKLHAARLCRQSLLCPLCALRRAQKALEGYRDRAAVVFASEPRLRPFVVTFTVRDGPDLAERFAHLKRSLQRLNHRRRSGIGRARARGSEWGSVFGAVWSYEVKRGKNSGEWHPHVHAFVLAEQAPDEARLRAEWHFITGDSFMVECHPAWIEDAGQRRPWVAADGVEALVPAFAEVFKYAVKVGELEPRETWEVWRVLRGKRLVDSVGAFRGVQIPETLLDEPLDGPFLDYVYRYFSPLLRGRVWSSVGPGKAPIEGYSLVGVERSFACETGSSVKAAPPGAPAEPAAALTAR